MPDIRLDTSFPSHPKTRKLRKLGGPGIIDSLITLWCYAGLYKQNGTLSNMDDSDIAFAADFDCEPDRPDQFVRILIDAGFIDDFEPRKLHDWGDHQRWVIHAPKRKAQARKAAAKRWERKDQKECPEHTEGNAVSNADSKMSNAPSPTPNPPPNPIPPPVPVPEEKKEGTPFSDQGETAEEVRRQIAESRASVKPPKLTQLQQSFEDWRSTDTMWLEQYKMSEGLKAQVKAQVEGVYNIVNFVDSFIGDLRHDANNRADKFKDIPTEQDWRNLLKSYVQTGIKDGKLGNFGMKNPMSLDQERKHEDRKRRTV